MEREVRPLVKGWSAGEKEYGGRRFRFFEKDDSVVVCGGIGAEAARRAAEATIEMYSPDVIYSAGFAGALDPKLKVGDVLLPRRLVNAGDGSSFEMEIGGGVLVSFGAVAGKDQKKKLRESFSADAVDMEAAAVARAAQLRGVRFRRGEGYLRRIRFRASGDGTVRRREWKILGGAVCAVCGRASMVVGASGTIGGEQRAGVASAQRVAGKKYGTDGGDF